MARHETCLRTVAEFLGGGERFGLRRNSVAER